MLSEDNLIRKRRGIPIKLNGGVKFYEKSKIESFSH